jgi:hypothetical protein
MALMNIPTNQGGRMDQQLMGSMRLYLPRYQQQAMVRSQMSQAQPQESLPGPVDSSNQGSQ